MDLRFIIQLFCVALVAMAALSVPAHVSASVPLEIEAPPFDKSITTHGPRKVINFVDQGVDDRADFIALFTDQFGEDVLVKRPWVAVQVDHNNVVLRVTSPSLGDAMPSWEPEQRLTIPPGGFVLLAFDDSWATKDFRKFLATRFRPGDVVTLRRASDVISVHDLRSDDSPVYVSLRLDNLPLYTTTDPTTILAGSVRGYHLGRGIQLMANDRELSVTPDGAFAAEYVLDPGANYITLTLQLDNQMRDQASIVVYRKEDHAAPKEVLLWIEQGPNANRFKTSETIYDTLVAAKEAGVTAVALDVKGIEGYAAYRLNDLTGRPYVSEITAPTRAGASRELDLLAEFIKHARTLGLKVHASLNAFAEGSIAHGAFAILNRHLDWEEVVYRPEDNGRMVRLRESQYGRSGALVAFVNPAHPEAREYQLRSFEEVIKNYDIDGVIIDRGRYDNIFADFSDLSRTQFEAYLAERGKVLQHWPDDVFTYRGTVRVDGPLIDEWYTYRSAVIRDFVADLRKIVDTYSETDSRNVQLSAYVGSWYETLYIHGINWASPDFTYNPQLRFPQASLYTDDYRQTSYLPYLDFLMIGTYQSTVDEVRRYITLGNILTQGDVPLYPGMALANVQDPAVQRAVFQSGLQLADGLMIFDLTQANFPVMKAALEDREYVKQYQLGISNPRDPESHIAADFLNVNRNEDNINVYTDAYGSSTNTSTWGVEVIVDPTGKVVRVVNKVQAMFWSWTGVELNNSRIPVGGLVISAEDRSGQRTNRQLIANAYRVGDQMRAALLGGVTDYDGLGVTSDTVEIRGDIVVLGMGAGAPDAVRPSVEVTLNGQAAQIDEAGNFWALVTLHDDVVGGESSRGHEITVVVRVDGMVTHRHTVTVNRLADGVTDRASE